METFTETTEQIEGTVTTVLFYNSENGYSVIRLRCKGESVTAVGTMPNVCTGLQITLDGTWVNHPTYGCQFRAQHMEQHLPTESQSIYDYLSTRIIKGIGARTAKRIVERFGNRTFEVLESYPEQLATLKGISMKKALAIQAEFVQHAGMRTLLEFLACHSMPPELSLKLWKQYGKRAIDLIRSDPYMLVDTELGICFRDADRLAASLGIRVDDPQRIEAGILYVLTHNLDLGHIFLPQPQLLMVAGQLLSTTETPVSADELQEGLKRLQLQNKVFCQSIAGVDAVYREDLYTAEVEVADRMIALCANSLTPPAHIHAIIDHIQREQGIAYAHQQRQAIVLASQVQVMLLTGGPGTGKTTCTRGILRLFDELGFHTSLTAPTGRAAKRLSELCGAEATTIHRLLEAGYDKTTGKLAFNKNESEPLDADAVIVDEMSMVDIPLMAALLTALKPHCRLILVGDPDQLPSVGPGQLFDHLIRSELVPMVRLTEIFRQAQQSSIVMNAHRVNEGQLPALTNTRSNDFFFLKRCDGQSVVETILELCSRRLPQYMGIPSEQIQVLSPTRKYVTGTANLNQSLQSVLNPASPTKNEKKCGSVTFRVGDRVMQVRNNYDVMWYEQQSEKNGIGIFNGDIGTITDISPRGDLLTVNFEGRIVDYTPDMLPELELAYAMTVHKSQGNEYRAVVLAAFHGAPMLLTRGVLYTAITRAKDLLVIVGREEVLFQMVENSRQSRRYSGLRARLVGAMTQAPSLGISPPVVSG